MRYSVYHILLTTIDTRLTIKEMFQNKEQKNLQNFDFLLYMVLFIILCSVSEPSSDTLLLYISNEKYALFMLYFMWPVQKLLTWSLQKKCKLIIFVVSFQWNVIIMHTKSKNVVLCSFAFFKLLFYVPKGATKQ